jgi:hypothetical protein
MRLVYQNFPHTARIFTTPFDQFTLNLNTYGYGSHIDTEQRRNAIIQPNVGVLLSKQEESRWQSMILL